MNEGGRTLELTSTAALITGGASGIGFALAERFLKAGAEVLICGRREEKLLEARRKHPELKTRVCDVALETDRIALYDWAVSECPGLNALVNNAGVQLRMNLARSERWERVQEEIAVNFEAPVHLSMLFIPHLKNQGRAAILNVTSGLAFAPKTDVPVYCATKAALHSFTLSLRHQLANTPIEVIEIIPPAVNTDLGGPGLHTFGVPLEEFADTVMKGLEAGVKEIVHGFSAQSSRASRAELDEMFKRLNEAAH